MKRTWFLSGGYLVLRPCEGPAQKPDPHILLPGRCCLVDSGLGKLVLLSFFLWPSGSLSTHRNREAGGRPTMAMPKFLDLPWWRIYSRMLTRCPRSPPKLQVHPQALSHRSQLPSQPCFPRRSTSCPRCLSGSICTLCTQRSKSEPHGRVG